MWPSAELHIHIEGSVEVELLVALSKRNGVALPTYDLDSLRQKYSFTNLQSFLDIYYENLSVFKTEEDFFDLGMAYFRRASTAGVRHAEIFFDPQTHLANDIPLGAVFGGLTAAREEAAATLDISSGLIMCFLRNLGADAAVDTLSAAMPFRDQFIGVGLDSSEVGFPPSLFTEVYKKAAAEGLHRVAHAGEEAGPDYIWEALDLLGVERIDHGNRALEDPDLVDRLRDEQIPLTVCPLSNVALKTGPADLAQHPLLTMLDEGLLVTINSDDPAYFGGYIDDNFAAITTALDLDNSQLALLAENSFTAAFLPDSRKNEHFDEVRRYAQR